MQPKRIERPIAEIDKVYESLIQVIEDHVMDTEKDIWGLVHTENIFIRGIDSEDMKLDLIELEKYELYRPFGEDSGFVRVPRRVK